MLREITRGFVLECDEGNIFFKREYNDTVTMICKTREDVVMHQRVFKPTIKSVDYFKDLIEKIKNVKKTEQEQHPISVTTVFPCDGYLKYRFHINSEPLQFITWEEHIRGDMMEAFKRALAWLENVLYQDSWYKFTSKNQEAQKEQFKNMEKRINDQQEIIEKLNISHDELKQNISDLTNELEETKKELVEISSQKLKVYDPSNDILPFLNSLEHDVIDDDDAPLSYYLNSYRHYEVLRLAQLLYYRKLLRDMDDHHIYQFIKDTLNFEELKLIRDKIIENGYKPISETFDADYFI